MCTYNKDIYKLRIYCRKIGYIPPSVTVLADKYNVDINVIVCDVRGVSKLIDERDNGELPDLPRASCVRCTENLILI